MNLLFWCEFPQQTNWEELNSLLKLNNLKIKTYVTCSSLKEFKKIKSLSNIKIEGAWPTLPLTEGYWFSSHVSKKAIDSIDQFKGLKIKLDLETPIPLTSSFSNPISLSFKVVKDLLRSGKNKEYLRNKLKKLSKDTSIILSTYPMPRFILNKMGFLEDKRLTYNYFYYSTVFPKFLKSTYKFYFKMFMKTKNKDKDYFALGLIGPGIFKDETIYKDINEFKKDVDFFKKEGVKNLVLFELSYLTKRENPDEWIKYIKSLQTR